MQILLALYDPGAPTTAGSHWSWHSSMLSQATLDRFFYEVANKNRPEQPHLLRPGRLWAGVARVSEDLLAAYRFVDGGRDEQGRLGRWVLVAAFVPVAEALGKDLTLLWRLPEFERIVRSASHERPVASPEMLDTRLSLSWVEKNLSEPIGGSIEFIEERTAIREAGRLIAAATPDQWWHCTIQWRNERPVVQFLQLSSSMVAEVADVANLTTPDARSTADGVRQTPIREPDATAIGREIQSRNVMRRTILRTMRRSLLDRSLLAFVAGMLVGWIAAVFAGHGRDIVDPVGRAIPSAPDTLRKKERAPAGKTSNRRAIRSEWLHE